MAIKASATITLSFMVDVKATYRYYKLQASTATAPSVPTTRPPSGWTDVEPSYTTGSTNTLYFVDCTVFTNNTFDYSAVSVSSAYEAAKEAFNKAVAAGNTANSANNKVDNLQIGGRNLLLQTKTISTPWRYIGSAKPTVDIDGFYYSTLRNTWGNYLCQFLALESVTYTISFYAKAESTVTLEIKDDSISNEVLAHKQISTTDWSKYSVSIKPTVLSATPKITFLTRQNATNIYIKKIKLEKGNKATDWTPAPEDVDSAIEDAKNEAAKTATNYIYYDTTNGLQIGDKSSGKWAGTRAQIKADSYNILNQNGTELASFGANEVRLGNESEDATISMRKGSLNISNLNKGDYDYTQIGCKGNLDVSSEDYTSDVKYKKGGMLTTIDHESLIEWQNLRNYKWSGLKSYTWDDLNGIEFVAQRDKYFETRLYSEERDDSSDNGFNGARVSLKTSIGSGDNTITSEIDLQADKINLQADKINLKGKTMLDYMMPVGYIFQWVPTTGGPDLSTADKVKAYYGFGTWEEISGRFLLGRSSSYGVGSTGGNETHTHTNPVTGSTTLTVDQIPGHTHTRGNMNITGSYQVWWSTVNNPWGAFYGEAPTQNGSQGGGGTATQYYDRIVFDASRTWSGNTSSTGGSQGHAHSMGNTGSTNHMPPYLSVYIWKRIA